MILLTPQIPHRPYYSRVCVAIVAGYHLAIHGFN